MDAEYLKKTVGPALTQAMTSMIVEQPRDAVEYVGNYLLAYVDREEGKEAQSEKYKKCELVFKQQEAAEAAKVAATAEAEATKSLPGEDVLIAELEASKDIVELYPQVLEMIRKGSGATSVYLGIKDQAADTGAAMITFTHGTPGSDMEGMVLKGKATEDEEGPEEGVSFRIFKAIEKEPAPEGDGEADAEGGAVPAAPAGPEYPPYLLIPNVVREKSIKFFGIPKLGSYAVLAVRYLTCLHEDGIKMTEAEEGEGAMYPNTIPRTLVVGMHTMGQHGREFVESELVFAKKLVDALSAALQTADKSYFTAEVDRRQAAASSNEQYAKIVNDLKADADAKEGEIPEDMVEEDKALKRAEIQFQTAAIILSEIKKELLSIGDYRMPPKSEPVRVMSSLLYCLGYPKASFVEPATGKVNWEKMRSLISQDLVDKAVSFNPSEEGVSVPVDVVDPLLADISYDSLAAQTMNAHAAIFYAVQHYAARARELFSQASEKRTREAAAAEAEAE